VASQGEASTQLYAQGPQGQMVPVVSQGPPASSQGEARTQLYAQGSQGQMVPVASQGEASTQLYAQGPQGQMVPVVSQGPPASSQGEARTQLYAQGSQGQMAPAQSQQSAEVQMEEQSESPGDFDVTPNLIEENIQKVDRKTEFLLKMLTSLKDNNLFTKHWSKSAQELRSGVDIKRAMKQLQKIRTKYTGEERRIFYEGFKEELRDPQERELFVDARVEDWQKAQRIYNEIAPILAKVREYAMSEGLLKGQIQSLMGADFPAERIEGILQDLSSKMQ
jgi:hypothetical protein